MTVPPLPLRVRCCRSCGRRVLFCRAPNGSTQVLDAVAPVYRVVEWEVDEEGRLVAPRAIERDAASFVSHFATCPTPDEFSRSTTRRRVSP